MEFSEVLTKKPRNGLSKNFAVKQLFKLNMLCSQEEALAKLVMHYSEESIKKCGNLSKLVQNRATFEKLVWFLLKKRRCFSS